MIKVEGKGLYGNYSTGHGYQNKVMANTVAKSAAYIGAADTTAFTGAGNLSFLEKLKKAFFPKGKALSELQNRFLELFPNKERNLYTKMKSASEFIKGEMGGIVITAIGTGLVAPFPIAFNPFVKAKPGATQEEKDEVRRTKAYSAWRQPLSAVLALFIQAGVQKPIDKFLQNLTNDPESAVKFRGWVLNQTSLNDEKYLARKVKKEFKAGEYKFEAGKIFDKSGAVIGEAEDLKDAISKVAKKRTESQLDAIAKTLEKEGIIKMGETQIYNEATAAVLNDNIDKYIEAIQDMKKDDFHLDFHKQRAKALVENEEELTKLLGSDALKDLNRVVDGKGIERIEYAEMEKYIKSIIPKASNSDVETILKEILEKPEAVRESRCARTIDRIRIVKEACGGVFDQDKYYEYMKNQNKMLQDKIDILEKLKIKDLKSATPEQIKEIIEKLPEVFHYDSSNKELHRVFKRNGMFKDNLEALKTKIPKDMAKTYKEFTGNKFGIFKQLTKVGVGVCITLPITCTALNWIYPRFMEKFFPKLAGIKKDADVKKDGGAR